MNAWKIIWRDLTDWLHKKRLFAIDVDSYKTLELVAERQNRSPEEVAEQLFEQAALEQDTQLHVPYCWEQLSSRQKQVAAHICRGDSTRQIAAQLNIAQTTVKSHVEIVLRKFGLNSRTALRQLLALWDLNDYL